jgi:hypothetical protein
VAVEQQFGAFDAAEVCDRKSNDLYVRSPGATWASDKPPRERGDILARAPYFLG